MWFAVKTYVIRDIILTFICNVKNKIYSRIKPLT